MAGLTAAVPAALAHSKRARRLGHNEAKFVVYTATATGARSSENSYGQSLSAAPMVSAPTAARAGGEANEWGQPSPPALLSIGMRMRRMQGRVDGP